MGSLTPTTPPIPLTTTAPGPAQLRQVHAHHLRLDLPLSNLISISPDYALTVLLHAPHPDPRLCNRALLALSRTTSASPRRVLLAYARMRRAGVWPDRFTLPLLLRTAARDSEGKTVAREAHSLAAKIGLDDEPFVQTALVGVYGAHHRAGDARRVFDRMSHRDLVAWSVMINSYCLSGRYKDALQLFAEMNASGLEPDATILTTALSACARTSDLATGRALHSYIIESIDISATNVQLQSALISMYCNCGSMTAAERIYNTLSPKNLVASTAMVHGYAKLGNVEVARSIFDQIPEKDLILWSTMISGYAENDRPDEALELFSEMQAFGVRPDQVTMLSVISACTNLGALDQAKLIHMFINKNGFHRIVSIHNALIDMYSKCGSLVDARAVFDGMLRRDVITWTSMITGFAMHGDAGSAIEMFNEMVEAGYKPNGVTFISLLYACSHAGMVEEGKQLFKSMAVEHDIEPKLEHYGCLVDLLGRAKLTHEAYELIESMPFRPNVVVWGALLGACRVHGDVELGELAAKRLLELDPDHDGAYVLLSNIYAKARRWVDVAEVRMMMKSRGLSKEKGGSWIEVNSCVHRFVTGDESHPMSNKIHSKLDEIVVILESLGYAPDTAGVLVDVEGEEEKRAAVLRHSEKLALSFGLINSKRGSCIRITNNLRICEDCHSFMKLVSVVFDREIVLRERTRFHHYRGGRCSCKDFW